MMERSGKLGVMEYGRLNRFRRRRFLGFPRCNQLTATLDALKHETRVFFDVRLLQRLVVDGRWREARGYLHRFLPCQGDQMLVDAPTAVRFITHLNVLDDLAHGKLGGNDAADDLGTQIEAIPSTMTDPHYSEAVRTVFDMRSHRPSCDPLDWEIIRLKASQIVKDLVTQTPGFRHMLWLTRCPINQCYTIGGLQRYRKNIGQMSAFHLAHRFLQKKRCPAPLRTQGSSSEPMDLEELIDETLLAGKEAREHSDSCSEGIPGSPVASFGKRCGISPADPVTKCLSQEEYYVESASAAKLPRATGEFHQDDVNVPSGGLDPMHVLKKMSAMGEISGAMVTLLMNTCIGPDHNMLVEKLLEQEKLLYELRIDCIKAKGCTSVGTDFI